MRPEGSDCGELSNDDHGDESGHVEHSGADNGVEGAAHALASTDMCNGFAMALALLICSEPEAEMSMEHAEHFMELKSLGPWYFEVDTDVEETSGPGAFTLPLFANLFIIVERLVTRLDICSNCLVRPPPPCRAHLLHTTRCCFRRTDCYARAD